jgi:hypothetical protein
VHTSTSWTPSTRSICHSLVVVVGYLRLLRRRPAGHPALTRPLTVRGLAEDAALALGVATVGLVMVLRLPANPIGWLSAAAGLAGSWFIPFEPWIDRLLHDDRPLPLVAQLVAVVGDYSWAPAIALGVTLPAQPSKAGRASRPHRSRPVTGLVAVAVVGSPVRFRWTPRARTTSMRCA